MKFCKICCKNNFPLENSMEMETRKPKLWSADPTMTPWDYLDPFDSIMSIHMTQLWLWLAFKLMPKPKIFPLIANCTSKWEIKSQQNSYLRNHLTNFTQIFTQCEEHPGADSVNRRTLNSFCGLRKSTFCVQFRANFGCCGNPGRYSKNTKKFISQKLFGRFQQSFYTSWGASRAKFCQLANPEFNQFFFEIKLHLCHDRHWLHRSMSKTSTSNCLAHRHPISKPLLP